MFRVAIVGRPNVGKSTLFNRLCGTRKAIVGDEPGITRDRIYGTVNWAGRSIEILDTGGMVPDVRDVIPQKILEQVEKAISESDLILLLVDGRAGVTAPDEQLLPILRRTAKPIWVVVNKIDVPELDAHAAAFYAFGAEKLFAVSAEHVRGTGELLDSIVERAGESSSESVTEPAGEIAVAVVGRPNVGKSSLVNRLLGIERAIVSEIPGTTRDAFDTLLIRDGVRYRIIDTAGIRRKGRTEARTEKISVVMARKNLERADVAILLLDAEEGVTKLDAAIGGYADESGCSVIIALNKWDKVEKDGHTVLEFTDAIRRRMKYLAYAPVLTISALTGQRVSKLFEMSKAAFEARQIHVPTGLLNNIFAPDLAQQWTANNPGQHLNIRYVTQARSSPPTFVVFTTSSRPLHFSIERFLANQLRERFGFYGTPIRIRQRTKPPRRR
ncbi:MAG: ribosome biogenesis GTPase Der [Acidobacteriota bacterium]